MRLSRRKFFEGTAASVLTASFDGRALAEAPPRAKPPLEEFPYDAVAVSGTHQQALRENVTSVLLSLDDDTLLRPFREMNPRASGAAISGRDLGGWYCWRPNYDHHHDDAGFAPAHSFGQWTSALARLYAGSQFAGSSDPEVKARVIGLHAGLREAISPDYFAQTRFAAYSYDKLVCGLNDAHRLLGDRSAFTTLDQVTAAAKPSLPGRAIDREVQWKLGRDISWMWDESFTLPENLFLAAGLGAGPAYQRLADDYLLNDTYFEPLSRGVNVLADKHAYSYINALSSAMQAWFSAGSEMHLQAAKNGFDLLELQSFATGGWGPDELLRKPGLGDLAKSLTASHNGFETPCGGYAHMKLSRALLRATRDGRYGDSMERVLHNAVLGSLPLEPNGRAFYNSDYNVTGRRVYSVHPWPCCSGTLPQVIADLGINTYLHEPGGHAPDSIWANLYQPSELRWTAHGRSLALKQAGSYPLDTTVRLAITASDPATFALKLRIPGWAKESASLKLNGRIFPLQTQQGFATIERRWRTGDAVELNLPMPLRLEDLPAGDGPLKQRTAALMRGPLVLFALRNPGETGPLAISEEALLKAQQTGPAEWTATSATGDRRFVPFTEVADRTYATYLAIS